MNLQISLTVMLTHGHKVGDFTYFILSSRDECKLHYDFIIQIPQGAQRSNGGLIWRFVV
jgi:hypothetical protein